MWRKYVLDKLHLGKNYSVFGYLFNVRKATIYSIWSEVSLNRNTLKIRFCIVWLLKILWLKLVETYSCIFPRNNASALTGLVFLVTLWNLPNVNNVCLIPVVVKAEHLIPVLILLQDFPKSSLPSGQRLTLLTLCNILFFSERICIIIFCLKWWLLSSKYFHLLYDTPDICNKNYEYLPNEGSFSQK